MDFEPEVVERIALGGRLHDIGKVGIPDAILDKPGPLTPEEFEIMKLHPAIGDDLVAPIRTMQELRPMIRWHHESLDGHGYPDGLPGDVIPVEAFVVKVADYWEAITSRRPVPRPDARGDGGQDAALRGPPAHPGRHHRLLPDRHRRRAGGAAGRRAGLTSPAVTRGRARPGPSP